MYTLILLPLLIFIARILDVTFGTLRIVYVSKGMKALATTVAFFEVLIWILAIVKIMQDLTNFVNYFAFAGGFAAVTYVGITLENKLAMGLASLWIVTENDASDLVKHLKSRKLVFETDGATSMRGKVRVVFAITRRKDLVPTIQELNPDSFVSVSDAKSIDLLSARVAKGDNVLNRMGRRMRHVAAMKSPRKGK